MQLHSRRDRTHGSSPDSSRDGVPRNLEGISNRHSSYVRLIDKGSHQNFSQIGHLQQKIASSHEATLFDRERVHNSVKGSTHIRFRQYILRRIEGGLCLRSLCVAPRQLRVRVAFRLLLTEESKLRVDAGERVFCGPHLPCRGCTLLLKLFQCVQVSL